MVKYHFMIKSMVRYAGVLYFFLGAPGKAGREGGIAVRLKWKLDWAMVERGSILGYIAA